LYAVYIVRRCSI